MRALDMPDILVLLVAAASAVVVLDLAFLRPQRLRDGTLTRVPWAVMQARSLLPVILFVLVFRAFLFEPYRIPSESMMPGLIDGDFILVSKFSYSLRLPFFDTPFLRTGEPRRGDVIVFRSPADPSVNLIKRLVGLPGDHVVVRENRLLINGTAVVQQSEGTYAGAGGFSGSLLERERFGKSDHTIMLAPDRAAADFDGIVPPAHYFFMGDNRNDSEDSRYPAVGFVPRSRLVGHALRIWMNWQIPGWPRLRRIGMAIR